jgi:hypothetical protein
VFLAILATSAAFADIIYFKDGMRTVCLEKAWEESGVVKCEYDGVLLSYPKTDVERIEKRRARKPPAKPAAANTVSKAAAPKQTKAPATTARPSDGNQFYDPRRTHKYWIGKNGKYKTFKAAVAALSKQYNRSTDWVQSHMGETNDINEIHRNLAAGLASKKATAVKSKSTKIKAVEFYNPRRKHKYWTSETARHDTFREAMLALANEYGRSTEWVKRHLGEVNDLHTIRKNLTVRKQHEAAQ